MNDQLTRALTERAERFAEGHESDVHVEGVLRRAAEIRRGRRMRATMVMAAAILAVAIPAGISQLGSSPEKPSDGPATPTGDTTFGLTGLSQGPLPRTGYLEPGTKESVLMVHSPAGNHTHRVTAIDAHLNGASGSQVIDVAFIEGGFLVAYSDEGKQTAVFYGDDASGSPLTWPMEGGFAVSADRNIAAFAEPGGTVMAVQDGGSRYFEIGQMPIQGTGLSVAAVLGTNCSGRSDQPSCWIYVNSSGGPQATWLTGPHLVPRMDAHYRSTADVDTKSETAGIVSVTDGGSCSEVRDNNANLLQRTCKRRFVAFSPDGKHVLATGAYGDGLGDTELAILDTADGHVRLDLHGATGAVITQMIWEDDTHVLATVYQNGRRAVVRFGLDGSRDLALAPIRYSTDVPGESSYVLPPR